jgi:CheY-like chemotaxis protein/chromosome segregation ATPase
MSTKVLVFESDAAFAGELRTELSKLGCSTNVVDDGNAGLQQAATDKPDLILLSIELPRMNGFSVCNKLKKDNKLKDVPLIIMSTESSDETFEQHRKLRTRAEDYVHKPIAFGELLQHINQFVKLAEIPEGGASEGIVIDDEISSIDIEEEGTLVVERAAPPPPPRHKSNAPQRHASEAPRQAEAQLKNVDDDIDAFIEGGFGKMTNAPTNGTSPVAEVAEPSKRKSVAPSGSPDVPAAPVDDGRVADLEKQLQAAREEAQQLRSDFDSRMEAEQKKMDAELDDLRTKLAQGAGKGGVSSREFLDLREALNKKDKEILALKEQLGKKDKEIVDVRERSLALERAKADLDDKVIASLRELEEAKEKADALGRDQAQAKKAADDFKNRLAKAQSEIETRVADVNETRASLAKVQGELEERARELEEARVKAAEDAATHGEAIAAARSELEGSLAKMQAEHASGMEAVRAEKASALEAAEQAASAAMAEAVAARESELKAESDARLGALHRAHQEEVNKVRGEHAQEKESLGAEHANAMESARSAHANALAEAKSEADTRLAEREAEIEAKRSAEVAAIEQRRSEEVAALEQRRSEEVAAAERAATERIAVVTSTATERVADLERDRDQRIAAAEHDAAERVTAAERDRDQRIADLERSRDEMVAMMRAEIAKLNEEKQHENAINSARISELEQRVAELTSARDTLERELATAKDRIVVLEAETAALRTELAESKAAHARESARADKAYAKWEGDRAALERAKDALAVVLAQIEDAEGRSIS